MLGLAQTTGVAASRMSSRGPAGQIPFNGCRLGSLKTADVALRAPEVPRHDPRQGLRQDQEEDPRHDPRQEDHKRDPRQEDHKHDPRHDPRQEDLKHDPRHDPRQEDHKHDPRQDLRQDPVDLFEGVFREVSLPDVRELLLHGRVYMSEGDWCTARSVCQQALQRCNGNSKDARTIRLLLKEISLFQQRSIHDLEAPAGTLDWRDIQQRPVEKVFESHHDMPQSLFFIRHEEHVPDMRNEGGVRSSVGFTVGRRLLSHQYRHGKISELHCSLITPSMILGPLEDQRMREDGVVVYFRPLKSEEKLLFMKRLLEEQTLRMIEVVFPFPVLHPESRQELSCPCDGWQISETLAEQLEEGEEILREYSRQFLLSLGQPDLHLYDPACSNGVFLQAMKVALPRCRTIGQDLSPNMVAYAARRLDEVHCGDCRIPAVGQASVDVVFCRFLNSEIVKTADVMDLLLPPSRCVKVGGYLVIFGHTPVLLSAAELRVMSGWQLLQSVAGGVRWNGIFQYYVCRRLE